MVEGGLVPDCRGAVMSEQIFQSVRAERAQRHGEKSRRRRAARGHPADKKVILFVHAG